jgi:putative addiction module killer protein
MKAPPKVRGLKQYEDQSKTSPYDVWFSRLLSKDIKTATVLDRHVQRMGQGNFGDSEPVGDGISELKINYGSGFRVYYRIVEDAIILLLMGGNKSTQSSDILKAKENWKDYKARFIGGKS